MAEDDTLRIDHPVTTLRSLAVDRLRQAIISGRFPAGARLVERSLCDQLGVSRTVVREAIRYLEAEGLVDSSGRSGPIVAQMNWEDARQIYDIRRLLEAAAASDCARQADETVAARLRSALARLHLAFEEGRTSELQAATTAFYQAIFTSAGHSVAWEIVQRLNGRISRLRALTLASTNRRVSGPAHMTRICDAICAKDAAAAAAAVDAHLRDAAEIARQALGGDAATELA